MRKIRHLAQKALHGPGLAVVERLNLYSKARTFTVVVIAVATPAFLIGFLVAQADQINDQLDLIEVAGQRLGLNMADPKTDLLFSLSLLYLVQLPLIFSCVFFVSALNRISYHLAAAEGVERDFLLVSAASTRRQATALARARLKSVSEDDPLPYYALLTKLAETAGFERTQLTFCADPDNATYLSDIVFGADLSITQDQ